MWPRLFAEQGNKVPHQRDIHFCCAWKTCGERPAASVVGSRHNSESGTRWYPAAGSSDTRNLFFQVSRTVRWRLRSSPRTSRIVRQGSSKTERFVRRAGWAVVNRPRSGRPLEADRAMVFSKRTPQVAVRGGHCCAQTRRLHDSRYSMLYSCARDQRPVTGPRKTKILFGRETPACGKCCGGIGPGRFGPDRGFGVNTKDSLMA